MGYFDLKKQAQNTSGKKGGYFDLQKRVSPLIESIRKKENDRKKQNNFERVQEDTSQALQNFQDVNSSWRNKLNTFLGRGVSAPTLANETPEYTGQRKAEEAKQMPIINRVAGLGKSVSFGAGDLISDAVQAGSYRLGGKQRIDDMNQKQLEQQSEIARYMSNPAVSRKTKENLLEISKQLRPVLASDIYDFANKTESQIIGESIGAFFDYATFGVGSTGLKAVLAKGGVGGALKTLGTKEGIKAASRFVAKQMAGGAVTGAGGGLGMGLKENERGADLAKTIGTSAATMSVAQPVLAIGGAGAVQVARKSTSKLLDTLITKRVTTRASLAIEKELGKLNPDEISLVRESLDNGLTKEDAIRDIKELRSVDSPDEMFDDVIPAKTEVKVAPEAPKLTSKPVIPETPIQTPVKEITPPKTAKEAISKGMTEDDWVSSQPIKKTELTGAMGHRPTFEDMPPAHNLLETEMLPKDVYTQPDYSIGNGAIRRGEKAANESWAVLQKIKGKPNAEITIYRASPKKELRNGDWVSLSKEYARLESLSEGVKVNSFKVKAKDVIFAGDDINEFGYWGHSTESTSQLRADYQLAKSQPIKEIPHKEVESDLMVESKNKFLLKVNKKEWWRTAENESGKAERGQFLASSYKEAEFYGRPLDKPFKVNIKNPLIGDESSIMKVLGLPIPSQELSIANRFALDKKMATIAKEKGYDSIALTTIKGYKEFLSSGKMPRSIELNDLTNFNISQPIKEVPKVKKVEPKKIVKAEVEAPKVADKTKKVSESPIIKRINQNLDDAHKLNPALDVTNHKEQLKLAEKNILDNPQKAYSDAVFVKDINAPLKTSTLAALLENAKLKKDQKAIAEIGMAIARHGRKSGEEVEMIKAMIENNPTNKGLINLARAKLQGVAARFKNIPVKEGEDVMSKSAEIVKKKSKDILKKDIKIKVQKARDLIRSLSC